jgi:hypothetical protein
LKVDEMKNLPGLSGGTEKAKKVPERNFMSPKPFG